MRSLHFTTYPFPCHSICGVYTVRKRYISIIHEAVSSFEANVILVPPGTVLGEKEFTISTFS